MHDNQHNYSVEKVKEQTMNNVSEAELYKLYVTDRKTIAITKRKEVMTYQQRNLNWQFNKRSGAVVHTNYADGMLQIHDSSKQAKERWTGSGSRLSENSSVGKAGRELR